MAIPRVGATDVPTASSLVIVSVVPPTGVALTAGGVDVPLAPPTLIGPGREAETGARVTFWRVQAASGFLPASSELVLSAAGLQGAPRVTLTSVKTAAGYDKEQGTPAKLKSLKLTRVRYPVEQIAAGACVFAEYVGYISFESDAATFPGTPADSIVNTIALRPRNGGAAEQSLTYDGSTAYAGDPPPRFAPATGWTPYLDPSLEYCVTIQSFGVGDLARLAVTSNTICAQVDQVDAPGAGIVPDAGASAGSDAATGGADAPASPDGMSKPLAGGGQSSGCVVGGDAPRPLRGLGVAALALLALIAWSSGRGRSRRR